GRNNLQDELLTFRMSDKDDIWFHAKGIPGSHVVMVTEGKEPSGQDYTEACEIAAYYSSATADAAEVDYTRVKNVKKPPAAKPGFVIYKTNFSAYVQRKKPIGKK
ncbi:MAG: NFACT RNA binding domain-containing protein, partial [Clostridia bacterium]|nr:NFACT RNA binding domain-containing protein [Clostridia bacterium]